MPRIGPTSPAGLGADPRPTGPAALAAPWADAGDGEAEAAAGAEEENEGRRRRNSRASPTTSSRERGATGSIPWSASSARYSPRCIACLPAFIGQLQVVRHRALGEDSLKEIAALRLRRLADLCRGSHHSKFSFHESVLGWLCERVKVSHKGARVHVAGLHYRAARAAMWRTGAYVRSAGVVVEPLIGSPSQQSPAKSVAQKAARMVRIVSGVLPFVDTAVGIIAVPIGVAMLIANIVREKNPEPPSGPPRLRVRNGVRVNNTGLEVHT